MFMRRACLVSVLCVSCFDGSDAHGLPCNSNAECGNELCIDNICGGAGTSSSSTLPSTSESESLTTDMTGTDTLGPTTSETDPSTSMTTMETLTSAEESDSDDSSTGDPVGCQPPPDPGACARGQIVDATPTIVIDEYSSPDIGRAMSITAGDFLNDDGLPEIAVVSLDPSLLRIFENDNTRGDSLGQWSTSGYGLSGGVFDAINPYDVVVGDFACDGGTIFALAGQGDVFGWVIWTDGSGFEPIIDIQNFPTNSYSMTVADVVDDEMNYPDIIVSGNSHVTVLINNYGFDTNQYRIEDRAGYPFAEPWDTAVIDVAGSKRILVPQGGEDDTEAPGNQWVYSLRVDASDAVLEYANPPHVDENMFRNPWALAVGDFDGDMLPDLAVAERNLDDPDSNEGTNTAGMIRFYSIDGIDDLNDFASRETGIGPNALAAADFDCDGVSDLIIGNGGPSQPAPTGGESQILYGGGNLGTTALEGIGITDMSSASRIAIADFDNDGRPEAALADYGLPAAPGARFVIVDIE